MSKKYGIVVDVAKCTGCYNCQLACKDENCGETHEGYTAAQPMTGQFWLHVSEVERGAFPKVKLNHVPKMCGHCDNPACMTQAKNGAVYKREDGVVIIDPEKAKGQKDIVSTCPHRVIFWNEALQLPQKCDMCAHLLDKGYAEPRCVELCPTGALTFGDLNDPNSEVAKLVAEKAPESLNAAYGLNENVLYLNVPKMCAHCDNPACMTQAVHGAVYKREDGIVVIDPGKAAKLKEIVNTCPHRVMYWNELL